MQRAAGTVATGGSTVAGRRLFRSGIVLGLGLGGFADGIVLHQILGWHHLVCTTATCRPETVAELTRQNMQDGFFHLAMWVLTIAGVALVVRAVSFGPLGVGRVVTGGSVAGWGLFNLVEGLVDHQLLGIHHVKPDSPYWFAYDMLFLASGVVLWLAGKALARAGGGAVTETAPGPEISPSGSARPRPAS